MKTPINFLLIFFFVFGLTTQDSYAQKKAQSVITAGLGVGYLNMSVTLAGANSKELKTSAIPTLNFMYDLGLLDNFSMGLAVGYNALHIEEEKTVTTYPNPGTTTYVSTGDYSRLNIAMRPLFHWGKREDLDWHAGVRIGYSIWDASFTTTDPFNEPDYEAQDLYSIQALVGARAYFSEKVGMTIDVGVGTPYFVGIGMSVKL